MSHQQFGVVLTVSGARSAVKPSSLRVAFKGPSMHTTKMHTTCQSAQMAWWWLISPTPASAVVMGITNSVSRICLLPAYKVRKEVMAASMKAAAMPVPLPVHLYTYTALHQSATEACQALIIQLCIRHGEHWYSEAWGQGAAV